MPRAYDRSQLAIDRNPLDGLSVDLGSLPKLDAAAIWQGFLDGIKELSGLDLSGPVEFVTSVLEALVAALGNAGATIEAIIAGLAAATGLDFSGPAEFVASIMGALGDLGATIADMFAALAQATGLVLDQGPLVFLQSLVEALVNDVQLVVQAICSAFPLDWTHGPAAFVDSLTAIFNDLGVNITTVVDNVNLLLSQWLGLSFGSVGTFFESLLDKFSELTGMDFAHGPAAFVESIIHLIQQAITSAVTNIQDVLNTIGSALGFPAVPGFDLGELQSWISQTVFGFIDPNRLPLIPVSHITDTSVNLLSNPYFADTAIYDPTGLWSVDPTVTHYPVGGSARTLCTDASHELLSVDLIAVSEGQKLDLSAWVRMANVVGDGDNGIQYSVVTFTTADGSGLSTTTNVATLSTYGTQDWQKLAGIYTVPANVKSLRVRIAVSENAVRGTVWWDELWCSKQGLLPTAFVQGLDTTIATINASVAGFISELAKFLNLSEWKKFLDGITGQVNTNLAAAVNNAVSMMANLNIDGTFLASAISGLLPDLQKTWDALYEALTGKQPTATQTTPELTAEQIRELISTTTANSTALAALQAATQGGLTNMVASGDDFERENPAGVNATTGEVLWQEKYTTAPATAGGFALPAGTFRGQATWTDKGNAANLGQFRRVRAADANTYSAYQRVTRVTGTSVAEPGVYLLGVQTAAPAVDYIYARVSADFLRYVYVAYDGDGNIILGYTTTGPAGEAAGILARTPVGTPASKPTAGASYALECGDSADVLSYRVLRNNVTVLAYQDTAAKTAALKDLKGWGWGGRAVPRFTGQSTPSSVHSVTVADIPPEPTLGSFVHVVRRAVAAVTKPLGESLLPANTFDDVVRTSPDVAFDLATGILLVTKPGPYNITVRLDTTDIQFASEEWEVLLYRVTGTNTRELLFRGGQVGAPNGILASSAANAVQSTFSFYSQGVNQQYVVGMRSQAAEKINGTADGANTWLTVTKGT